MTVEEIAARAEVSRRTFFRYFATKDAVVFHHHAARVEAFRQAARGAALAGRPYDAVRTAILMLASDFQAAAAQEYERYLLVSSSSALVARELELDQVWEGAMAEVLAGEHPTAETAQQGALLAGAVMGVIRAGLRTWYESGCTRDLLVIGVQALDVVDRGAQQLYR